MKRVVRPRAYGIVPVLILALIVLLLPPDGQQRSGWMLFAGNFHLLTIHFPIALLFLVPVLELAGAHRRLPHLRASVEFVLILALAGSLFAAVLGWSLARSGGFSGGLVTQHLWAGVSVAAACWLCWMLRARLKQPRGVLAYWSALIFTLALVSFTGYRGGQLTQGQNHLTEAMPASLRSVLHIKLTPVAAAVPPNRATFYGGRVEPILAANCYSCHGANEQRGQLRLDSYAFIMRGGKDGKVITPGNIKTSDLVRRIHLPRSDNDAMPPQGKRALTADEMKVIELWIASGASETLPVGGIKGAPTNMVAPKEVIFPKFNPEAIEKLRAAHADEVAALQKQYPNILNYESRETDKLALNAYLLGAKFGDSDLSAFKPVLADIATVDLSNTSVSDQSAPLLAAMKNFRVLRLAHTKISDATVDKLSALPQLESLNVLGTAVSPASLKAVAHLPKLQHVYVAGTKITPGIATTPDLKKELVF